MSNLVLASLALSLCTAVWAQGDPTLWTSWVPLAVRSPYLSTWMATTNVPFNASNVDGVARAPTNWPQFLQSGINGWSGLIRIDQTRTFMWLGDPGAPGGLNRSILTNIQITPTRTIMNMTAGPLDLTVTFLSPIEPADPVMQSLPFSYVSLEATSNDGQQHDVQVYSDISGEWLSGDRTQQMKWTTQAATSLVYHQTSLANQQSLAEITNQAEDGTVFYAMQTLPSQTFMEDLDATCRGAFKTNGKLTNQITVPPHTISNPFPVFAISVDLGTIVTTANPLVWSIGMTRDPVVAYTGANGSQSRSAYWASAFTTALDAVTAFVIDYQNALARAVALDGKIMTAAAGVSAHYADLVALAARQAMGGTELTVGRSTSDASQWNTSDIKMFMKNVGTDGRVNPVEGLYEAFPFFLYVNASYGGWLLEPVLEFANTSRWTFPYAPQDIGTAYPNATGNTAPHDQGVEQSGNMLIMTLAHARVSGDGTLIGRYYGLLKDWADYLVSNAFPLTASQQSADTTDTKGNLTNVALKGIIGIQAMAEMSAAANLSSDAQHYSSTAASLAALWQAQAVSSDGKHILTSFGDLDTSLAVTYNLFADKLLATDLISSNLYNAQTASLQSVVSGSSAGLPIDQSLSGQANTVWSLFTAAYTSDLNVRDSIIDQIWGRVSSNATDTGIFSTSYSLGKAQGAPISNGGSPFIGGVFAPLSLNIANVTIHVPLNGSSGSTSSSPDTPSGAPGSAPSNTPKKSSNAGAIAGGVVGGVGGAALLALLGFLYWRRRHPRAASPEAGHVDLITPVPFAYTPAPASAPAMSETAPLHGVGVGVGYGAGLGLPASKAQEAMASAGASGSRPSQSTLGAPQSTPSASAYSSSSGAGSSRNLPAGAVVSPTASTDTGLSHSDVLGLRTEVENLRRVMQTLHETTYEPPPGYEPERDE